MGLKTRTGWSLIHRTKDSVCRQDDICGHASSRFRNTYALYDGQTRKTSESVCTVQRLRFVRSSATATIPRYEPGALLARRMSLSRLTWLLRGEAASFLSGRSFALPGICPTCAATTEKKKQRKTKCEREAPSFFVSLLCFPFPRESQVRAR